MKIYLAVILYFLINSNSLNAHELWLEADQYKLKRVTTHSKYQSWTRFSG